MADAVRPLAEAGGHRLQAVDVDADPGLKARYGWDVPLLFDGDAEICRHQIDLPALREWLQRNSGTADSKIR